MNVNRDYWQGEHTLARDIKYCDYMSTLANNGIIIPDQPIDESVFMFACTNDKLCRHAFVKAERDLLNPYVINITEKEYQPAINNYYPTYAGNAGTTSGAQPWTANLTRVGMDATISNIPAVAPIIEMKTKYLALCIYVGIRTISNVTTDAAGTKHFTVTGYREMTYDEYKTNYIDGLGTTNIVVTMFAYCYYGSGTLRTEDRRIRIASSNGNVPYGLPSGMVDSNTTGIQNADRKLLLGSETQNTWLIQGGYWTTSLNAGKNTILYFPFTNTLYWNFGVISTEIGSYVISSYIDDLAGLSFAYSAYSATGFWYFGNVNDAQTYNLDGDIDPTIAHRGKVDDEGKVNADANATDNKGLTDDPTQMHSATGYSGNENVDPNNYTDETPITKPNLSVISAFNRTYAINYTSIRSLADWLWNADESKFDEIVTGLGLMGERPIEGIIDVRLYPFNVAQLLHVQGTENIKIGRTQSPISGLIIGTSDNVIIDLGSCTFNRKFKSFLDYSPYTEARLYIPYCGIIPIDTAEFMGHEISAKMIVDIVTGACTVMIYRDKIIMYYAQGVCGVSIPFTGTDSSAYASSVLGAVAGGVTSLAAGVASGGSMIGIGNSMMKHASQTTALANNRLSEFNKGKGMSMAGHAAIAGGVGNSVMSFWEAATTPVQYASGGNATPSCANYQPQYPYFIIDRPIPNVPDGYGHNVGFACIKTDVLSHFSGFTVCSNVDTSGFAQATEAERGELKALLEAGVFI